MIRRVLVVVAAVLVTPLAQAQERTWIGGGFGLQTTPAAMLGDGREIVKGLGLHMLDRDARWAVPRLTVGLDLEERIGVDLGASWFADAFEATSTTPIAYRVRRDVVPFTGALRWVGRPGGARPLLAIGPTVVLSHFEESGWLGDSKVTSVGFGAQARFAYRTDFGESARLWYGLTGQWLYLPRTNPMLRDGGHTGTIALELGLDIGL